MERDRLKKLLPSSVAKKRLWLDREEQALSLHRQIERLLHEPELLERMRQQIPIVKTIVEDAAEMETRFKELVGGRPAE